MTDPDARDRHPMPDESPANPDITPVRLDPRQRRLRVAGVVLVVLVLIFGGYVVAPWILPPWIVEGPLVQQATTDGAVLVWYTSRPAPGLQVLVSQEDADQSEAMARGWTVASSGRRNVARIRGLLAHQQYRYRIMQGNRTLAQAVLRTAALPGTPFHFVVFGDSGDASQTQYALARRIEQVDPDFLVHTGDLVYPRGARTAYRRAFFEPYRRLIRRVAFWPVPGNHDVAKPDFGAPFREVFELPGNGPEQVTPEHAYWFDYADARFVMIDSNLPERVLAERVAPWLEATFAGFPGLWRFVVLHHPPYTVGAHKPSEAVRKALVPAFEAAGVDIVFSGHDHMYERTRPMRHGQPAERGVVYIVTGAGGARLYEARPREQWPAYVARVYTGQHSFTHIRIAEPRLELEQIALDGQVIDTWSVQKP